MKFLATQLTYFFSQTQIRQNVRALIKYLIFLVTVIFVFTVLFHFIMLYVEGREHSWVTGLYWTLTVMSTLGFGDITFQSDIGRVFSIVVLLSGIILLLIMLPFAFIRFFYAPWLEAQIHFRSPRDAPANIKGHILICEYDSICENLIKELKLNGFRYFVIEPDPVVAARLLDEDISVVTGDRDSRETYERLRVSQARMVFANSGDTTNTNITLTIREVDPNVPIATLANAEDSIDILELSGATHVLPLKQELGRHLASRINVGPERAHVIGSFRDWLVSEFTVHETPLAGLTIRETRLREQTGVNIVGIWERGRLLAADPETRLTDSSVAVGIGDKDQIARLNAFLGVSQRKSNPVLIIGGGGVGLAAALALKAKGVRVNMVECKPELRERIAAIPDQLVIGDAADRDTLMQAGLQETPLVILTTNDDAINIYLSIYCRRLNPNLRIVSRITHERNLEAIHRAGADFVLSYAELGSASILSLLQGRELLMMGEGVEFFQTQLPPALAGKTLQQSQIGARTGLIVLALQVGERTITNLAPTTLLAKDSQLTLLGTTEQRQAFMNAYQMI
jgi:Trk K+ transport system NAD-binding subunit